MLDQLWERIDGGVAERVLFVQVAQRALAPGSNLVRSVASTGVCWDNAWRESFWTTLEVEFYDCYLWPPKPPLNSPSATGSNGSTTDADATQPSL
jgi:hypothetical protein